ncbi:TIGR02444 family protein [Novosphingobium mangrovi (ex Huang et al. 2023)]|uniref:TIGR02444 family protein n=1 Tax=Novosphingobium mangrovi (ex Huang et al. 2023) TaxID=2976432 RepID=A0ABT2IB61_9SPHN|nr:TIGR02444 family protein [Novosphingobium mangrovi (ex Huang et al. 2023)]MCT2402065.1 TIGR02444 family protein [Novosphingobium mangrovi (ex Huang et al. 2023)]
MPQESDGASVRVEQHAAAFWGYSLHIYAKPGVAASCLTLQDQHGCDVNTVLLCLWLAGARCSVLAVSDIEAAQHSAAAANERFVQPVRSVRRWMKQWCRGTPESETNAAAYAALKTAELYGERLVQLQMIAGLDLDQLTRAESSEAAVRASFANYCTLTGTPGGVAEELGELVATAWH